MKLAFSSNAFTGCGLDRTIDVLASIGYDGIEIMADVPHAFPLHLSEDDIEGIRKTLAAKHLEISNINAFMHHADGDTYHPSWIEKDPLLRAKRVDYTLRCIDLAAKLGARNLSTEPGGPLDGMSAGEGMRLFRDGLDAVAGRAREMGIRILIEPEPGLLIENSAQFLSLFETLDSTVFGLNFDIGHFFCVGEDPARLVRELKDVTGHFHLEDIADSRVHHHLMPGRGAIDLAGVLSEIDAAGYTGFVTVELYTYADRPEEAAKEAFDYLTALREWR
ncbi:MAG: sugar phosphate isomerase/epimerase [Syntrophobacteraceae bacterium]|nr:sugar phosphate isomerase/epimerase [Syntrophobacteraceae bacterium]